MTTVTTGVKSSREPSKTTGAYIRYCVQVPCVSRNSELLGYTNRFLQCNLALTVIGNSAVKIAMTVKRRNMPSEHGAKQQANLNFQTGWVDTHHTVVAGML